jgi:hypothetical protein
VSSLGLVLVGGVLLLALVSTRLVVAWVGLLLALLGTTGNEVVGIAAV